MADMVEIRWHGRGGQGTVTAAKVLADACRRWKVRVIDCRFRPLNSTSDNYKPKVKSQNEDEYYIHKGWLDRQVRAFRRAVRRQNIALLLDLPNGRYINGVERGYIPT